MKQKPIISPRIMTETKPHKPAKPTPGPNLIRVGPTTKRGDAARKAWESRKGVR